MQIHTEEYRGFNIKIHPDEDARNPREEYDHLGTMVCESHRLGDEQVDDLDEHMRDLAIEAVPGLENMLDYFLGDEDDAEELIGKVVHPIISKHFIVLPLYLYNHSGIAINTTPWASGQMGVIYVSREQAIAEYGEKDHEEKAAKRLKAEVEEYDHYISGRVYGYTIEPKDTNKGIDCEDSYWGFYGDYDDGYMMDQAKSAINHAIKDYKEEVIEAKRERKQTEHFFKTCWAD